jgi:cytochrome c oxidase assembly protein subunit 11
MSWKPSSRRAGTALAAVGVIAGMLGLTAASVPLYRLFCQVTGYGGTTGVAERAPDAVLDRTITVRFNADIDPKLPWGFRPAQRTMEVRLGEQNLAFYEAVNRADRPVVGTATYNVTPHSAGYYFSKIACFCFDEQTLQAGEAVDMPVSFFVDPAILDDPSARDVREITLSYTFFMREEATAALAAGKRKAEPAS